MSGEMNHREGRIKKLEVGDNGDGVDRLNDLPETLLIKVLSSMPIRAAINTSVLSRRWRFLWSYHLNLEFGIDDSGKLVNWVLALHIYILIAMVNHVEKLKLLLVTHAFYKLPNCRFLCESLVCMELRSCKFTPPRSIRLVALKSLSLISSETSDSAILDFTSSCPVIEKLKLKSCNGFADLTIVLRNPSLVELELYDYHLTDGGIEIDVPYVTSLVIISDKLRNRYMLSNLSSVTKATFNLERFQDEQDNFTVVEIVSSLAHAKHLHLCRLCLQVLSIYEIIRKRGPSIQPASLDIKTELVKFEIPGLAHLLKQCSDTESLNIRLITDRVHQIFSDLWFKSGMVFEEKSAFECKDMTEDLINYSEGNFWASIESSAATILQRMKRVVIHGFFNISFLQRNLDEYVEGKGRILGLLWREIKLVEILLGSLMNLESFTIAVFEGACVSKCSPMGRKLLSFPRASEKAKLRFL